MNSTRKSIGISFATQYVELIIHFLGVLALARILSPDDIGTYSVAAFLMTLLHVFRDFGVVQYIIQEHELTTEKIQSAMGVAIILALAVALVMWACSGLVADFYDNPAIEEILVIMSASFAISPFGSLLIGILRREMKMGAIFHIKIFSALSHVAVALVLALNGFGAISLAWANFAGILSFGIAANLMRPKNTPWLPRFTNIKTILSFGGIASLGNAANNAGTNIPDLVIGKVMNMAAVGYFSRATGLVQLFTRLITSALLPLVLPYFSQLRREGKDLATPYLSAVEQLTALAWPFFAALMLLAYPMVRALYGTTMGCLCSFGRTAVPRRCRFVHFIVRCASHGCKWAGQGLDLLPSSRPAIAHHRCAYRIHTWTHCNRDCTHRFRVHDACRHFVVLAQDHTGWTASITHGMQKKCADYLMQRGRPVQCKNILGRRSFKPLAPPVDRHSWCDDWLDKLHIADTPSAGGAFIFFRSSCAVCGAPKIIKQP